VLCDSSLRIQGKIVIIVLSEFEKFYFIFDRFSILLKEIIKKNRSLRLCDTQSASQCVDF